MKHRKVADIKAQTQRGAQILRLVNVAAVVTTSQCLPNVTQRLQWLEQKDPSSLASGNSLCELHQGRAL